MDYTSYQLKKWLDRLQQVFTTNSLHVFWVVQLIS